MLNDIIEKAKKRAREIQETQYEDTCTVIERRTQRNATTKRDEQTEVETLTDQACKLIFKKEGTPSQSSTTIDAVVEEIILLISPEVQIKPGSKIEVTHKGIKENYSHSGKSQIFATHQEIALTLFKGWA